jgi:drug/metabolite transporter (DMT)-like permease
MVITMQRSNPAAVSLYRYCGVFYGFFWDLAVFKRTFDFLQVAGLSVIFCANLGALMLKIQADRMEVLIEPEEGKQEQEK